MLNRYRIWKETPITWGSYIKLTKWSFIISIAYAAIYIGILYKEEIIDKFKKFGKNNDN